MIKGALIFAAGSACGVVIGALTGVVLGFEMAEVIARSARSSKTTIVTPEANSSSTTQTEENHVVQEAGSVQGP